jgi:hypothetical protein
MSAIEPVKKDTQPQAATAGGRGRNRNRKGKRQEGITGRGVKSDFKGVTDDMSGNVFECYEEQNDRRQYAKTLEALESYVKKKLQYSEDLASLFVEDMKEPKVPLPTDPTANGATSTTLSDMIYAEEVKQYVKRKASLTSNLATIHAVVWGQCSDAMKAKIKSLTDYKEKTEANDCFWLLKKIKAVTLQFDEKRNVFISLLDARTSLLNCRQQQGQSASDYLETLRGWADTIEYHGGTVAENFTLIAEKDDSGKARTDEERKALARDRTLAIMFIRRADPTRYGTLIAELSNQYAMGKDEYPKDVSSAYSLLVNYKTPTNARAHDRTNERTAAATTNARVVTEGTAVTFAQKAALKPGTNGIVHDDVTCYNCQDKGHYANDCPVEKTATTLTQQGYMMTQKSVSGIDPTWILLDSQSTISVFCNSDMLYNMRKSEDVMRAITNGGYQDSNMIGYFPNLGDVWYNKDSIANILSLAEVRKVCRVTMDSSNEPSINVHRFDGSIMKFVEHESGLYVYNCKNTTNTTVSNYTMVSTVATQKKMFTPREIASADEARALYRKIGRPSEPEFEMILRSNLIRNCPVTPEDAKRALLIYGPDIAAIKGKTTRSAPSERVPTFEAVQLPPPIMEHHRKVTICIDFFFVQKIIYLHTISRDIGFRTVSCVLDRNKPTIMREMRAVIKLYESRGFHVCDIQADSEFECIRHDVRPIELNIVPADSHVGEVERSIRTLKERLRACVHGLPFKRLPKVMITHMVTDAVRCLNQFPWKYGVSDTMSPLSIVTGAPLPDYSNMRIEFGAYAQVFEDHTPTNTPRARTLGAIALNPMGNAQGDYYFMSLATGHKISRHSWTELPLTETAIARVEAIAFDEKRPLIQETGLVVEWRHDQEIDESEYDRNYVPPEREPFDEQTDPDDLDEIEDDELADLIADAHIEAVDEQNESDQRVCDTQVMPGAETEPSVQQDDDSEDDDNTLMPVEVDVIDDNADAPAETEDDIDDEDMNELPGTDPTQYESDEHTSEHGDEVNDAVGVTESNTGRAYNLRERKEKSVHFADAIDNPYDSKSYFPPTQLTQVGEDVNKRIFGFVMTQMTAKAGIKKHGKAARAAMVQEFGQLEDLKVYEPVDATSLTKEQKLGALRAINLIKEKRDGRLKGRTVADGRSQRPLYEKHETASPTVSTDALLLTVAIDANEGRDVATADVAGAYLKADMTDFVLMKFVDESVDILCDMNKKYEDFVVTEKGKKVLYVQLLKAIYGCVTSALLWYNVFRSTLEEMGFVLNPYDPCVANAVIEGNQCTIAWYVDDMKVSHVDSNVVTMIIGKLEERFGKMTVTRGKEHVFLGMNIKYTNERTATVTMRSYLEEAIIESGLNVTHSVATPANKGLFEVDEASPRLGTNEAESFHSVVAKLLYVSLRARMDLLLAVGFLSTRVSKSTKQDQFKLKRLLQYIHGTLELQYTLGADDMGKIRTWVDASYAVHPDMKSHTGGIISLGTGGIMCKSTKQKLNTKSSTEAELVGASDYLPNTIWVKLFLEAQGYTVTDNILEQDNESAIKLETNGRASAGPRSRHIDIRYYWVKDRLQSDSLTVRHCPTLEMLADFFTKPLQGTLFRKFRDVILGYAHVNTLRCHVIIEDPLPAPFEERVGIGRVDDGKVTDVDDEGFITVRTKRNKGKNKNGSKNPNNEIQILGAKNTNTNTNSNNTNGVRILTTKNLNQHTTCKGIDSEKCKSVSRAILLKQSS